MKQEFEVVRNCIQHNCGDSLCPAPDALNRLEERLNVAEGMITKLAEGEAGCGCCATWDSKADAVAYCKTHGVPFKEET